MKGEDSGEGTGSVGEGTDNMVEGLAIE